MSSFKMQADFQISRERYALIAEGLTTYILPPGICEIVSRSQLMDSLWLEQHPIPLDMLLHAISHTEDQVLKAYLKRLALVSIALEASSRSTTAKAYTLDPLFIWPLIMDSLLHLREGRVLSSVGSQGFLSIPLFRFESATGGRTILRLHIWDASLNDLIDGKQLQQFAIHSHVLHAQSWVLCGEVINTLYHMDHAAQTGLNFFKIDWDVSTKTAADNHKKSRLVNTGAPAPAIVSSREHIGMGKSYSVAAGEFHQSEVNPCYPITATLFLFSSQKGTASLSHVLGPGSVLQAPDLAYPQVDAGPLLEKLNLSIRNSSSE